MRSRSATATFWHLNCARVMAHTPWSSKLLHKAAMRLRTAKLWTTNLRLSAKFAVPMDVSVRQHNSGHPAVGLVGEHLFGGVPGQSDADGRAEKTLGQDARGQELFQAVLRRSRVEQSRCPITCTRSISSPVSTARCGATNLAADHGHHQQEARNDDALLRKHAARGHPRRRPGSRLRAFRICSEAHAHLTAFRDLCWRLESFLWRRRWLTRLIARRSGSALLRSLQTHRGAGDRCPLAACCATSTTVTGR